MRTMKGIAWLTRQVADSAVLSVQLILQDYWTTGCAQQARCTVPQATMLVVPESALRRSVSHSAYVCTNCTARSEVRAR